MRLQCLTPTRYVMGRATFPYACTGKPYPRVCNVCRPRVNEGRSYVNIMQVDHLTHETNAHVRYLESTFGPTYVCTCTY